MQQHPECPYDAEFCRVTRRHYVQQPVQAWTPVYDGNGVQINSDPNTFVDEYACDTCSGSWAQMRTAGQEPQTQVIRSPLVPTPR